MVIKSTTGNSTRLKNQAKKKLSVGVIFSWLEKYGGAERYLVECLRHWQFKHDITLYAAKINLDFLRAHGVTDAVKTVELQKPFEGENHLLLNTFLLPQLWRQEIAKHDVYNCHVWPNQYVDLHPMVWLCHEPLRSIYDLRYEQTIEDNGRDVSRNLHIYPKRNYDRIGTERIYEATLNAIEKMDRASKPTCTVGNSKYCAKYVGEIFNQPITEFVYPGVDQKNFPDLIKDTNLFVTASQLWPHKRVKLLIEALALTIDAQLIIIGSGPIKQDLITIVEKLGVDNRVFFLSGLSNEELNLVMARASAFLFSPIREPFGIVVLEAMAAGLPIIAVNEGGYTEVCEPEFSFLLDPEPAAFAEKIMFCQANPTIVKEMGLKAKIASKKYSWERTATELEKIIVKTYHSSATAVTPIDDEKQTYFGIHYMLWYGDGYGSAHWNDNLEFGGVTDKPALGYYGSNQGTTIEKHLPTLEEMQLDFAILNLHIGENGVNGLEIISIQNVFDLALKMKSKLRFTVQLCFYGNADRTEDLFHLETAIKFIQKLSLAENYFYLDDKPVLYWFWNTSFDRKKKIIEHLEDITENFTNIACSLRLPEGRDEINLTGNLFSGFYPYSPLEISSSENWEEIWTKAYDDAEKAGMRYPGVSISPGYDDRHLQSAVREPNPFRHVSRDKGKTFETCVNFVKGLDRIPRLVTITSFNEFHENTHIEPSQRYGTMFVEMTKNFVNGMKKSGASK